MLDRPPTTLRSLAIVLAAAAYALPATLGILSAVAHGSSHLMDEAREQRRTMASIGLVHSAPAPSSATASVTPDLRTAARVAADDVPALGVAVVHTHGGITHAHGGLVGAIVNGADAEDGHMTAGPTAPTVAVHLPAPETPALAVPPGMIAFEAVDMRAPTGHTRAPQPHPPRG